MEDKKKCANCSKEMMEGYVIESGFEYYCSDECLHNRYAREEWLSIYDDGSSDSYWTEFEE